MPIQNNNGSTKYRLIKGFQLICLLLLKNISFILHVFAITAAGGVPCVSPKITPYIIHSADYISLVL